MASASAHPDASGLPAVTPRRLVAYLGIVMAVAGAISYWFYDALAATAARRPATAPVLNHLMNRNESHDILILGNSRVRMHVNPRIVDSATGLDSYCAALDAGRVAEFWMMLRLYLRSHAAPRLVVMNLDFTCMNLRHDVHNFPEYISYLSDSVVYNTLVPYSSKLGNSVLYPWHSFTMLAAAPDDQKLVMLANILRGDGPAAPAVEGPSYKGFAPKNRRWSSLLLAKPYTAVASDDAFAVIDSITRDCRSHGIPLVVITAPLDTSYHTSVKKWEGVMNRIRSAADRNGLPYLDYRALPLSSRRDLFYNIEHLNAAGADEFSRILGGDLRKLIRDSDVVRRFSPSLR